MTETHKTGMTTTRVTRAERMAMPLAGDVLRDVAIENGACIRPIQLRRTDRETGQAETVLVPCGSTLDSVCPPCAERAKTLRAAQCREGWHLEDEPGIIPGPATEDQKWRITLRADAQQHRDQAEAAGQDTSDFDKLITELDAEITKAGIRGKAAPTRAKRRHRSTRRRQDAPDLPRRKVSRRTVGKTYTAPDGKAFRPSLFVTLTCPSYGRVGSDGTPADPQTYDYDRAARDALHFAALFDRFIQNLMGTRQVTATGSPGANPVRWRSRDCGHRSMPVQNRARGCPGAERQDLAGWLVPGDPHRRPGADPHDEIRVPAPAAATWPSRHAARNPRESLSVPVVVVVA